MSTPSTRPVRSAGAAGRPALFWPVLMVLLAAAVVAVVWTAHSSIETVGPPAASPQPLRTPSPAAVQEDLVVVQVSSHPTRGRAAAAAQRLVEEGYDAAVLLSDDYRPLNRGYFVVYVGPFPDTTDGRDQAQETQRRLPGSLVREIRAR